MKWLASEHCNHIDLIGVAGCGTGKATDGSEVVNKVFTSLKDSKKSYVFNVTEWQLLPSEILF